MTALTKPQSTQLPSVPAELPSKVRDYLASAGNALESRNLKPFLPADRAPDETQRAWLVNREGDLGRLLARCTADDTMAALGKMSVVLATRGTDDAAETDARLAIYAEALAGQVSRWALDEAAKRFIAGSVGDGRWLPKPAEWRSECERLELPWREERARILRVLNAEVLPSPEPVKAEEAQAMCETGVRLMSERSRRSLDAFRAEVAASRLADGQQERKVWTKEEAEAWLEREQSNPRPLPKLSDAALR